MVAAGGLSHYQNVACFLPVFQLCLFPLLLHLEIACLNCFDSISNPRLDDYAFGSQAEAVVSLFSMILMEMKARKARESSQRPLDQTPTTHDQNHGSAALGLEGVAC